MTSSAHSPGPWAVNPFLAQVDSAAIARDGDPLPVARMLWPTDERSEVETEANARLIAAAPDLVAELEWLAVFADIRSFDDSKTFARVNRGALRTIRDRARAAIARATGPDQ